MKNTKTHNIHDFEPIMEALVKSVGLRGTATLLNNIFVHGRLLDEMYGSCTQEQLDRLYECIEKLVTLAKEFE